MGYRRSEWDIVVQIPPTTGRRNRWRGFALFAVRVFRLDGQAKKLVAVFTGFNPCVEIILFSINVNVACVVWVAILFCMVVAELGTPIVFVVFLCPIFLSWLIFSLSEVIKALTFL